MDKTLQLHHKYVNLLTPVDFFFPLTLWYFLWVSQALLRLLKPHFSVCSPLLWKDGRCTDSGIHPARQRGAGGNDDWWARVSRQPQLWHRRNFGQLEAFTGSSRPTSDRQRRSFSADSSRRSRGTRNFSCEVFEFPIQAFQCSYHSSQGLFSFLFLSRSSPGSSLSPCPVVHTRDGSPPEHAHFSIIVSLLSTLQPCFPPHRAGLEGSIQSDLQC